jgi:hypothetical protein
MNSSLHHIRLVAGFEIRSFKHTNPAKRTLSRADCQTLAGALANDLARIVPEASTGLLVIGGGMLEPSELLRPGFGAWQALQDLAEPVIREQRDLARILAIGSHHGRLPDARLRPPELPPQGSMLGLPVLLIVNQADADDLSNRLEAELMERGGIQPPARAILAESTGIDTAHGQFLTLADQLALHQIQLDTAGLGAFWPPVEHALLADDEESTFELPGPLRVTWRPEDKVMSLDFVTFDQSTRPPSEYALWVRAYRSVSAIFDSHGISWQARSDLKHDDQRDCLIEDAGASDAAEGVTEQFQPDCGLIAWTVIEKGRQRNFYPLSGRGFNILSQAFRDDPRCTAERRGNMHYDKHTGTLNPAP